MTEAVTRKRIPANLENLQVVNQEALDKYNTIKSHPYLTTERMWVCSNPSIKVDLMIHKSKIDKHVRNLPEEEISEIMARNRVAKILNMKGYQCYSEAHGFKMINYANIADLILEPRKQEVIELFGKMFQIGEVYGIVNKEWGLEVSWNGLEKFRAKYIEEITELQEQYKQTYSDIRLVHKRSRLDEYAWLYHVTKEKYLNSQVDVDRRFLKELLESIKKEVEGDIITVNGNIAMSIEATLNIHIQQEIFKGLAVNEVILSRVCSKLSINPFFMLWKLQTSYYKRFNGFSPETTAESMNSEPVYPSAVTYNLDSIQSMGLKKLIESQSMNKQIEEALVISEDEKELHKSQKQLILEALSRKQEEIGKKKSNTNRINPKK